MDQHTFDQWSRSLAISGSRRRVLVGLAAGLVGAIGLTGRTPVDARTCSAAETICREHSTCCSGVCGPKDRAGRRQCQCAADKDCKGKNTVCEEGICVVSPFRACAAVAVENNQGSQNLTGCDLGGMTLVGWSFFNANLTGVNFTNTNLTTANFFGATLTGATWNNTICPSGVNSDTNGGHCRGQFIGGQTPTGA